MDLSTLVVFAAVVAAIATLGQYPWVRHYVHRVGPDRTRHLIREVLADPAVIKDFTSAIASHGTLDGGQSASLTAQRRWQADADKQAAKAAIFAAVAKRVGHVKAGMLMRVVPKDMMNAAVRMGEEWEHVLGPFIDSLPEQSESTANVNEWGWTKQP